MLPLRRSIIAMAQSSGSSALPSSNSPALKFQVRWQEGATVREGGKCSLGRQLSPHPGSSRGAAHSHCPQAFTYTTPQIGPRHKVASPPANELAGSRMRLSACCSAHGTPPLPDPPTQCRTPTISIRSRLTIPTSRCRPPITRLAGPQPAAFPSRAPHAILVPASLVGPCNPSYLPFILRPPHPVPPPPSPTSAPRWWPRRAAPAPAA